MNNEKIIKDLKSLNETFWINDKIQNNQNIELSIKDIKEAERRLKRFSDYIKVAFPETEKNGGIIESDLIKIDLMKKSIEKFTDQEIYGELYLKCDNALPISGSIKARGGIYEVLKFAEDLAIDKNFLDKNMDYSVFNTEKFKKLFSKYTIAVGSTGNLGLSIGIIGSKLGFKVVVHMSADAKKWKKDLLRSKGVKVKEYKSDYSKAVEKGRKEAKKDKKTYFVDDENSKTLFLGYSVAALRLKRQLKEKKIKVDKENPLFVYLPCGVGGAPGGIGFGLKSVFKENVHFFFAEPTHSPSMLLGLLTGKHEKISVNDIGINNITKADGLAVSRPSGFVGSVVENIISGCFTISDENLFRFLKLLKDSENIDLEPSALAGFLGPVKIFSSKSAKEYIEKNLIDISKINHIVWATGGSMVPKKERKKYYQIASKL
ncbi:MAG: D-serine ammonia-lyase [Bacillota bacterium]